MKRFKLLSNLDSAYVPGYGMLYKDTVLEGDQYEKYVPHLLEATEDAATKKHKSDADHKDKADSDHKDSKSKKAKDE